MKRETGSVKCETWTIKRETKNMNRELENDCSLVAVQEIIFDEESQQVIVGNSIFTYL